MGGMAVSKLANTIRANIERIRTDKSVSKNRLSTLTGIAQSQMIRLLNGDSEMQTDTIQRIAEALEVTLNDVVKEQEFAHE